MMVVGASFETRSKPDGNVVIGTTESFVLIWLSVNFSDMKQLCKKKNNRAKQVLND